MCCDRRIREGVFSLQQFPPVRLYGHFLRLSTLSAFSFLLFCLLFLVGGLGFPLVDPQGFGVLWGCVGCPDTFP